MGVDLSGLDLHKLAEVQMGVLVKKEQEIKDLKEQLKSQGKTGEL